MGDRSADPVPLREDVTARSVSALPKARRSGQGASQRLGMHPRIIVAGDLRSARYQRIMTDMVSGGEAALHAYAARDLL